MQMTESGYALGFSAFLATFFVVRLAAGFFAAATTFLAGAFFFFTTGFFFGVVFDATDLGTPLALSLLPRLSLAFSFVARAFAAGSKRGGEKEKLRVAVALNGVTTRFVTLPSIGRAWRADKREVKAPNILVWRVLTVVVNVHDGGDFIEDGYCVPVQGGGVRLG